MSNLQQMVQELASKYDYNPNEDYAETELKLREHLQSFLGTVKSFNMTYTELHADQMKARAKNSMIKKEASAEARQHRRVVRSARQVECIRKIDRVSSRFRCCDWFLCSKPNKIQIASEMQPD